MALRDYLRENSTQPLEDSLHRRLLNEITRSLDRIGITEPVEIFREVDLIQDDIRIGVVDLIALSHILHLYLIEAKVVRGHNPGKGKREITRQLRTAYDFFRENFGSEGRMIGVYRQTREKGFKHYELPRRIEDLARG